MKAMTNPFGAASAPPSSNNDVFFVLRYCREHFQRRLTEIAKLSGISSPEVLEAFSREIGEEHDELASASSTKPDGFGQTAGLTASRISLVGHDDLELDIRIGEISNHLKDNDRIDSWRVQLRYMTLLHQPRMTTENNPVGFGPICRGLWAICRESGVSLEQNLGQLDRLEKNLHERLPEVYTELNGLLEHHRVEPAPVQIIQRANGGRPGNRGGESAEAAAGNSGEAGDDDAEGTGDDYEPAGMNAMATLQQALHRQFSSAGHSAAGFHPGYASGHTSGGAGGNTIDASTMVMLNHLMERLSALELQQVPVHSGLGAVEPGGQAQIQLHALRSKDLDLPLGTPAAIALDTLSLIFESISATSDLPDVVKAAIGRLQIPLLRLSILDASFFADSQHPARRLINRMARAAVGLAQDTGCDHPTCAGLARVADEVRAKLETQDANLTLPLAEIEALITERDLSLQASVQPYTQLVREHEAQKTAGRHTQDWLSRTVDKTEEPAIREFLTEHWLRVMQSAYLEGGETGTRWKEYEATSEELLWSIQPRQTAEERKQLLALIPSLMKRINAGLDLVAVSNMARAPFLNLCFSLQTQALRNRPDAPVLPAQESAQPQIAPIIPTPHPSTETDPATDNAVQILEKNRKLVQYLGQPTATPSPWHSGGDAWKEGDWIDFHLPDGEHLCGRLCGQESPCATVVLFNSDWGYAVALAAPWLEQQLRAGEACVVSDTLLFDEAAERALGRIPAP
jgi:hypothetical protein